MHIDQRHGAEGEHDNSMRNTEDIARVGYVMNNADRYDLTEHNGKQVYSEAFRGKDNQPAAMIRASKKIDGTYYAVEAVAENKYKKLWIVSAYMNKNKSAVTQESNVSDETPNSTSKTSLASPALSVNNVTEDATDVKKKFSLFSENSSESENNSANARENAEETVQKAAEQEGKQEIQAVASLYAVNAKKESVPATTQCRGTNPLPSTLSSINVAELLEAVKDKFGDSLSDDVMNTLGASRVQNELSERLRFSLREREDGLDFVQGERHAECCGRKY